MRRNAAQNAKSKATAAAGTAEMNVVAQHKRIRGLEWYFYLTRPHAGIAYPSNQINIVKIPNTLLAETLIQIGSQRRGYAQGTLHPRQG
ncbi:hypothetical protein CCMA1212_008921 [Trichoderma ghanense]|uniref:Uncharacterized protein n=1 Tax=Trichoderma ghanense TaxID=65468 RepID=A0ABY2GWC5_9HYPO